MTVTTLPAVERDVYLSAALAWAWEHGWDGDELPAGSPTHTECPLYLATGLLIDEDVAIDPFTVPCRQYPLPLNAAAWVRKYDAGEYPELVR